MYKAFSFSYKKKDIIYTPFLVRIQNEATRRDSFIYETLSQKTMIFYHQDGSYFFLFWKFHNKELKVFHK